MTRRVTFSEDGARRIVNAVRGYERGNRDQPPIKFRQPGEEGGGEIRICKTTAEWLHNTTATLEVWESGSPAEPAANDPPETIEAANIFRDIAAGMFVAVAQAANGTWYAVEWQRLSCESGGSVPRIGGDDLAALAGYDQTKTQLLGHQGGCLVWIDTTTCDSGSS